MSLMVMEWLLIVQSHNHTDPHSQVLFPVVNEDTWNSDSILYS